jgi:hypothetical protein
MKLLRAIVGAGLLAGFVDLAAAFAISRAFNPGRLLRSIARGALGPGAVNGGVGTAALGLLFHLSIATGAAAVYIVASRKIRFLTDHPWIAGPIYGLGVYVFMNYFVVPHSAIGRYPGPFSRTTVELLAAHAFCVGLPIALVARATR